VPDLTRYAWLSIAAAVTTIALKSGAYLVTGSVGLLSDAAESGVNLVAAFVALVALTIAARPPDHDHQFGHTKAEYFAAAIEGIMIFVAAVFIIWAAVERFVRPEPIDNVGTGLAVSVVASVVNGVVAFVLVRAGRRHRSVTLVADGQHLYTDVWTSAGVVVGVALVWLTGWLRLDPIVAFLVGLNIVWTGSKLIRRSVDGLMDKALSPAAQARLTAVLDSLSGDEVRFHAVRTREAGRRHFVSMHVLVPGSWTVQQGHDLLEDVEARLREEFEDIVVDTHLEPIEDPRSYDDGEVPPVTPGPVA
jgi:cation diffusion facilitator family transporter